MPFLRRTQVYIYAHRDSGILHHSDRCKLDNLGRRHGRLQPESNEDAEMIRNSILKESDDSLYHYTDNFDGFINIFKKKIKPHYNDENFSHIFGNAKEYNSEGVSIQIPAIIAYPVFSLCDIPDNRHELHQKSYGYYGIGFKKEWAKHKYLNPVIYCHPESILANSLYSLFLYFFEKGREKMNDKEERAFNAFNYLLMFCKPYDNSFFEKEKADRRYYDEKEWRYIGLCDRRDEIPLSIPCFDREDNSVREFTKKKEAAQDKIMKNDRASDGELTVTLHFAIDDITHIILPTEEKKKEFLEKIAEIEEYRNDIDKIRDKIVIGKEDMKNEINKRLLILIKMIGVTQEKFFETVGILADTFQMGSSLSAEMLKSIAENFPVYSINWLLTGKGNPTLSNNQNSENNSGIGIIGNNVNGGGINDHKVIQEMIEMLKKKDEQIDNLLQIISKK
jgi:hypothetical protein